MTDSTVTAETIRTHGLTDAEYDRIRHALGRAPNMLELGIYSVMWSEHCSYKSSRLHLKKLPTQAPWVVHGPGENAGVVDIGDGDVAIFKMESHNHPSYIEPYQGAATGVGGILRDVFTMGARPVALLNALRFGAPDHPRMRHLIAGVVHGIGGYGNCVGVPTVGGETGFDPGYNGNILVNAMAVGIARREGIFLSAAAGIGNPVVYVGSKTGRDGIHGATMASAEFNDDSEEKRPTVQVGDPFTEKLLIEACLELMATDAIIAIQDMGAAGLTSSSVEMGAKGGVGIRLDLERVPCRETGMTPYEMMLSESQERMLIVLKPGREAEAGRIFHKWELDFAVIGTVIEGGNLELNFHGEQVGSIPLASLTEDAPVYDRPFVTSVPAPATARPERPGPVDPAADLLVLMASPHLASRRWIWEQYDHMVGADTVARPGGDAAIVRVHGSGKALALTTDCTPRYVAADPVVGGKQAVAETWRNLSAVGATPLAITDCLNFGNPERPAVMGEIVGAIAGMRDACIALDYPVVSGNVSLYNETNGRSVQPTPAIGGLGLLADYGRRASLAFRRSCDHILLLGATLGHLERSIHDLVLFDRAEGPPPPVDLAAERRNGDFLRQLIERGEVDTAHDISDGGLLVALAEMALAGNIGAFIDISALGLAPEAALYGEDQARYLIAVPRAAGPAILDAARSACVPAFHLGETGGEDLSVSNFLSVPLVRLRDAHEGFFPRLMAAGTNT